MRYTGMEMYLVLKAHESTIGQETSVLAFLPHLNFMHTGSVVLSEYQDFHTRNGLPICEALLNHSTVQTNLCHFVFAHICTFDAVTG